MHSEIFAMWEDEHFSSGNLVWDTTDMATRQGWESKLVRERVHETVGPGREASWLLQMGVASHQVRSPSKIFLWYKVSNLASFGDALVSAYHIEGEPSASLAMWCKVQHFSYHYLMSRIWNPMHTEWSKVRNFVSYLKGRVSDQVG